MAERGLGACLLLVLCAACTEAVRLHARRGRTTPTVVGTTMLDDREMAGQLPVFVDAFPNAGGTDLYIVLSFSPLFSKLELSTGEGWTNWTGAMWQCKWASQDMIPMYGRDAGSLQKRRFVAATAASVIHSTFDEAARNRTELHMRGVTAASEKGETFRWIHHSLVLECPIPRADSSESDKQWYLTLSASGEHVQYERSDIPVSRSSFVTPGTGIVMCTLLYKGGEETPPMLRPWVRFHAAQGIDQILLYVEDADPSWAYEAIADLPEAANVTVVPFFFGKLSEKRAFHMQSGMENHCLFQARNRAEWLAHADIDEYFDSRLEGGLSIREHLNRVPSDTGAVMVRSQFWGVAGSGGYDLPFPCFITCKKPGYFDSGIRSKWVARPVEVKISNPHILMMTGSAQLYNADPSTELRLNHYKECTPSMAAVRSRSKNQPGLCELPQNESEVDLSFRDRCTRILGG